MNNDKKNTFTWLTLSIAIPSLVGFVVNYTHNLVDAYWVAKLGPGAPTAVIIAGAIFSILMAVNEIIGISTVPLFTQAFGAKDNERTGYLIFQGILLKAILSVIFGFVFLFIVNNLLFLYTDKQLIIKMVQDYGNIFFLSLVIIMPYATMQTALRSIGEANKTMIIAILITIFNLLLDPILIFGKGAAAKITWDYLKISGVPLLGTGSADFPLFGSVPSLGIKGAALATVITQFMGILFSLYFLIGNRPGIRIFKKRFFKFDKEVIIKMLTIGIPGGAIAFIFNFENNFVTSLAANYGLSVSDGFGIASRIKGIMFMGTFGLSLGAAISVGQFIGAGRIDEIRRDMKKLILVSLGLLSIINIPIFIFSPFIISLFTDIPETIKSGSVFLRFFSIIPYLIATSLLFESVFMGAGKNFPRLIATSSVLILLEFPLMYTMQKVLGFPWYNIGIIQCGVGVVYIIVDYFMFRSKLWE